MVVWLGKLGATGGCNHGNEEQVSRVLDEENRVEFGGDAVVFFGRNIDIRGWWVGVKEKANAK